MNERIEFTLNGRPVSFQGDGDRILLWILRTDFGLTGPKYGCGEGHCGACTVLINDEATLACQTTVRAIAGTTVLTIEGLEKHDALHSIQEAFIRHRALQCGFCTPGMVLRAYSLLKTSPSASREEIIAAMDSNICRCGAHVRIIQAVESAAGAMKGGAA